MITMQPPNHLYTSLQVHQIIIITLLSDSYRCQIRPHSCQQEDIFIRVLKTNTSPYYN